MPTDRASGASSPPAMTREEHWWRSILRDVAFGLRNQPEVTREEMADVIERALEEGGPFAR